MIGRPTIAELLDVVRHELSTLLDRHDPAVAGPAAMIDEVLRALAVRAEYEVAWMLEEIAEVEAVAADVVEAGLDGDGLIESALAELRDGRASTLLTSLVAADYSRAGEVLSRCIESSIPAGGALLAKVETVLENRMAHEATIRGADFALVARG